MSLAAAAVKKRAVVYFATVLVVIAGLMSYGQLGQLEDPEYTVKTATITTLYPGASPEEVELEVSDRIETAIQELKQIKWIESLNRAGMSIVKVEILANFWGDDLQPVWDQMRRKIREVETDLPPGAGRPEINDDFGDVFGFQLALTGDGFSYRDLERFAKDLRKELSVVPGVGRVDLWGVQPQVIYLETRQTQLSQLGLSDASIESTLQTQNQVVDAGRLDLQEKRYRIAPTGAFQSVDDIGDLVVRPSTLDALQSEQIRAGITTGTEFIRIADFADVRRGYQDPPVQIMRYSDRKGATNAPEQFSMTLFGLCIIGQCELDVAPGEEPRLDQPAIGISITNKPGVNIVEVGNNIDARLNELASVFPVGLDVHRIHWQGEIVDKSVKGFLQSFAEAVAIVLAVLAIAMGWRMGVIIGTALIITVLGTFIIMALLGIDLHRMSLGALVIALGMMVDNAIVVADGMATRLQEGKDRVQAAVEAASKPAFPLLAATVIAVMAFYPIAGSPESTGEYCLSLFQVVAISLLFSWIVSLTLTPLQCIDMLKVQKGGSDPYAGGFFQGFRRLVKTTIRYRFPFLAVMVGILVVSVVGFGQVKQLFFPFSSMEKYMIDFYAPEGTRIEEVSAALAEAEAKIMEDPRVASIATYIGSGPPRFYLPVEPEEANQAYGQLVVNVANFRHIPEMIQELEPWFNETFPSALSSLRQFAVGPGKTWKFEVRVSGPAVADPAELRLQAEEYLDAVESVPGVNVARTDWMQRHQRVEPRYNTERAQLSAVTREDLANASKRAFDGRQVGLYREGDDLIPILLRYVPEERVEVANLPALQVRPTVSTETLPLAQVTDGVVTVWEDPIVRRRDRRRTVKIQANPDLIATTQMLVTDVTPLFEAIELPPGYTWEWGGEWEDTVDSQAALIPGLIPTAVTMCFILVYLYNAFRPLIIVMLTIPFVIIGITWGLLLFDVPFGFMSLLGAMSLSGMMIKNIIVLLDEAEQQLAAGQTRYDAIIMAAVSRVRPVCLAAATTVLGVVPLLADVFWVGMAVTIMAGLTVGTFLTMVLVPTLYATLYRLKGPPGEPSQTSNAQNLPPAAAGA